MGGSNSFHAMVKERLTERSCVWLGNWNEASKFVGDVTRKESLSTSVLVCDFPFKWIGLWFRAPILHKQFGIQSQRLILSQQSVGQIVEF